MLLRQTAKTLVFNNLQKHLNVLGKKAFIGENNEYYCLFATNFCIVFITRKSDG